MTLMSNVLINKFGELLTYILTTVIPNRDLGFQNEPAKMSNLYNIHALGMQKSVNQNHTNMVFLRAGAT